MFLGSYVVDNDTIISVHVRIARDRKANYATGLPSSDTIRAFRPRNRSLAYRVPKKVSGARLSDQNYAHIATLESAIKQIEKQDPSIFWIPGAYGIGTKRQCLGNMAEK